jgi:hypothetical protein
MIASLPPIIAVRFNPPVVGAAGFFLLKKLLVSYPAIKMKAYKVSSFVNNPRHEGPGCLAPLPDKSN